MECKKKTTVFWLFRLLALYHVCDKWKVKAGEGWKIWKKKKIFVVHLVVPVMLVWGDSHQNYMYAAVQWIPWFYETLKHLYLNLFHVSKRKCISAHLVFLRCILISSSLVYFFSGLIFSLDILYLRFNLHCLLSMYAKGLHSSLLFTCLRVSNIRCWVRLVIAVTRLQSEQSRVWVPAGPWVFPPVQSGRLNLFLQNIGSVTHMLWSTINRYGQCEQNL
jgi:hypothetical protein